MATQNLHCTRWMQQDGQLLWAAQGSLPSLLAACRISGSKAAWLITIQCFFVITSQQTAGITKLCAPHNSVSETSTPELSTLQAARRRCCRAFPLSTAGTLQPYAWHKGFPIADPMLWGPAGPPKCRLMSQALSAPK